jgi:hypothetical protein
MSLEMAHKVILPPKKNYIPQFLKQRDINSYYVIIGKYLLGKRVRAVSNSVFILHIVCVALKG